ncbi:hypothetical protein ACHQM5_027693 [Ranunculus cassubicifolius]
MRTPLHSLNPYLNLLHFFESSLPQPCLSITKQLHAQTILLSLSQDSFFTTKLISFYSLSRHLSLSRKLFESIQPKNIFLYNSMINACVKNQEFEYPFELFSRMCNNDHKVVGPDHFTLATLLKICSEIGELGIGEMMHCIGMKMGFLEDIVLGNSLMAMYGKCGSFGDVRKVFDEMPQRNSGSWNVLLSGISRNCEFDAGVVKIVRQMQVEEVELDAFTVSSLLPLCGLSGEKWDYGREIHCVIVKNGMNVYSDVHAGSCLIDLYSKRKKVEKSRQIFDRMTCRNVVTWTSIISAYVQNGYSEEALMLLREMQVKDRIEPNRVSIISVLPACNSLGVLREGKQIHGFCLRKEYNHEVFLNNALIDMYSKCGNLNYARHVFDSDSFCKDTITWSSMISGYGLNGKGNESISLYKTMIELGIKPDSITLVGALSGCAKSGMVAEGLNIYHSAISEYGVSPTVEICACMVDMLGRSGQVNKALEFVNAMPVKPGPSVWGSLFGASVAHNNSDMQELAYKSLIQLEPKNASNYVSLSNVYASQKKWDVVADLRKKMRGKGLRKTPGCSWISINNENHSFYVADKKHPRSDSINELLDNLKVIMKGTENIPQDMISY